MYKFIVIEGVDGAGKTSTSEALAQRLNAIYYKTPPAVFSELRKIFESEDQKLGRYYFYMSALLVATKEIKELLETTNVVCDRYSLSTRAYHETALGYTLEHEFEKLNLLKPDLTCMLKVDSLERTRRINSRNNIQYFEQDENHLDVVQALMEKLLHNSNENYHILNTTNQSIDEVIESIILKL